MKTNCLPDGDWPDTLISIRPLSRKAIPRARAGSLSFWSMVMWLILLVTSGPVVVVGQTVTTNKVDYFPGDKVLASGKGWNAFEQVDLLLTEQIFNNPGANLVVTTDASGSFSQEIYTVVEADRGAFFHLRATGKQSGHVATITFNDAGGDYGIDFSAYDPTRYVPASYQSFIASQSLPSGRMPSPLIATTSTGATNHAKTRESLMPESLGLGQIIPFEFHVRADAAGACRNDILTLSGEWLTETTNGGAFGYDGALGVVAAFVCTAPNGGLIDPDGDATVLSKTWTLNGKIIEGTVQLAGVDPGDELTVEVWVVLQNSIASNVGGNVKSRLTDAASTGTCEPGKINTGNQEIPLLQVDDFLSTDVDVAITKQDLDSDLVRVGDNFTYEISVTNSGPSVANTISVQDVLDANTSYVSHQFVDSQGSGWSFTQNSGTLTFTSDFLNIGETAKILLTVHVENSAPRNGVGGEGACVTGADLCNNVTVTTISDDTNSTNDSDSEPTGVMCTDLSLTAVITPVNCFGVGTGSLVLTTDGGRAPYTYLWSTGSTTKDLINLLAGTYTVTVTDATGCSGTKEFTITQPAAALFARTSVVDVACFGEMTGSVDLTVNGGTAPYGFVWNTDATSEDLSGLGFGIYNVTITDAQGCVFNASAEIKQPAAALFARTSVVDVACFGEMTGSVDLTVNGGTAPYGFVWNTGATSEDLSGLGFGIYNVTITDAQGCVFNASAEIKQPAAALFARTSVVDVACFGEATGSIDLTVNGGTAPYEFVWSNGASSEDLSGLGNGIYNVTITDAQGCEFTTSAEIKQPEAALFASTRVVDVACFGEMTGSIDLTVNGGTAPYGFVWSTGATSEDLSGLGNGIYNVTITDAQGCVFITSAEIKQPDAALSVNHYTIDVACFGEATGAIDLIVNGGTAPYTYAWNTGATTEDIAGLTNGVYQVTITDAMGCTLIDVAEIKQPDAALFARTSVVDVACFGEMTGSVDLTVNGGTAPYGFVWNTGATSEDLSGLGNGIYSVTITDAQGCVFNASAEIKQPDAALFASTRVVDVACFGEMTGSVDLTVNGGTAPYEFVWSTGATSEDLSGLGFGIYSVTITDAQGCVFTTSAEIKQPEAALFARTSVVDVACFGEMTGSVDLTVNGGTVPYEFVWSTGASSEDLSGLGFGIYNVTITDAQGCVFITSAEIKQPEARLSVIHYTIDVACFGEATGAIDLIVNGGTAPYTYAWNTGATTEDIAGLTNGVYQVTITDAMGCTLTDVAEIKQPAATLFARTSVVDVACFGEMTGSVDLTVNGGTAPYEFVWNTGASSEDLSGLGNGIYSVTITDAQGCVFTTSAEIKQPEAALFARTSVVDVACFGEMTGSVDLTVNGGTAPYEFVWSTGASSEDLSGLGFGIYSVTITDAQGCVFITSDEIKQPEARLSVIHYTIDVACFGEATGAIDLIVNGGTAPYTYAWNTGATSEDVAGLTNGVYQVTITDAMGCTLTDVAEIKQPATALFARTSAVDVACFGEMTGSVDLTVNGGTAPYEFVWNTGASSEDLSGLGNGIYSVTITDAQGCVFTTSAEIKQPEAALFARTSTVDVACFGEMTGSIDLTVNGGTAPYEFVWNTGASSEDLSGLGFGIYSVTITDAQGCVFTTSAEIKQPEARLSVIHYTIDVACFGEATGAIDLIVNGGTTPYTYAWNTGATTEDIAGLTNGVYQVTITDAMGCTLTDVAEIKQPAAALFARTSVVDVACFGEMTGSVDLTVNGGTAPYEFVWNTGASSEDLSGLGFGIYSVTITDAQGCVFNASAEIKQPAAALFARTSVVDVACFGEMTGSVDLTINGGTAPYGFVWNTGASSEDLSGLGFGIYSVTITDAQGCVFTTSAEIKQPDAALSTDITAQAVLCFGESSGSVNLTVNGGTAPYAYSWSNHATTQNLTGVSAGVYSVTITDAQGCIITTSITVEQPAAALSTEITAQAVLCFGESTGSVDLTVNGGTAPYAYSWSNHATTQDLTGVSAGLYSVNVTDANGCITSASIRVLQPMAALTCDIPYPGFDTPLCGNYQNNLLTVQAGGGTAPYTYHWSLDVNALSHGWSFVSGENGSVMNFVAGNSTAVFTVQIMDANGCETTCTYNMQACMAEYYCTYTQGFYGNEGGYACSTEGRGSTALQIMQSVLPVGEQQVFGLTSTNRFFTLYGLDIANGSIFKMLPGGKTPAPLGSYPGGATYSLNASWISVPMSKAKSTYGRIENNLLSQTIVLYFNMGLNDQRIMNGNFTLANFVLKPEIITAESPDCGLSVVVPLQDQYVTISAKVLDYLNSHYSGGATAGNLFDLSNRLLGGDPALVSFGPGGKATYAYVSAAEVSAAIDAINNIFHECRVYVPEEMQYVLGATTARNATAINISAEELDSEEVQGEVAANVTVEAYPNPFTDQVSLEFTSEIDARVELGVYTVQGVLVESLYKGSVKAHETQRVTFQQGGNQSGIYLYRLQVGNQVKVGKLIAVERK